MEPSVLQAVLNEQAALKRLIGLPRVLQMEASFHDARNFYLVTVRNTIFAVSVCQNMISPYFHRAFTPTATWKRF